MEKHQKRFVLGTIDRRAYGQYKDDIALYNLHSLRQISFVGMCAGIVLFLLCLPPFRLFGLTYAYLAIALLFTALYLWCRMGLIRVKGLVLPTFYVLSFLMFSVATVMGTYLGQDANATTILMLIIALPLFVIDKPWRLSLFLGIMSAVFCVADVLIKQNHALSRLDVANCIVFYLISMAVGAQAVQTKLSDIIIKRELKQQRDMDMLTNLNNRGSFERIVAQYLHESNQNAVLLILDIDNFKKVNDTMGHAYGDSLLQMVGETLKGAFRTSDTVSRLGGDEFVAFLPGVTDLNVIEEKVVLLMKKLAGIKMNGDGLDHVSVSIGLAQYPEDGCSFEDLYKQADTALYYAKRNGKGQYAVYSQNMELK